VRVPTASEGERAGLWTPRAWNIGVRARLLLAFLGISGFAVLAATAGIYAIRQVGARLNMVDARVPPTLTSLELSRSAERIIAAAPALLAATDRHRRDELKAHLAAEVSRLNATLRDLKSDRTEVQPLLEIEPFVSSLTANIVALENAVARRLAMNESIGISRREVFQTGAETQRLLAPTLMVMDSQISTLVEAARKADANDGGEVARQLVSVMELRRRNETAKGLFSAATDMLVEASTTEQARRLPVLIFQLGRVLRDLDATTGRLDPKLRPLFQEQVEKLRELVDGPNAIAGARKLELVLISEAEKRLAENAGLSAQLTAAVDRLAGAAKRDIGEATRGALSVQRLSTRVLVALVALSLLTSALIVWLYVGRNIVRRLTALNDGMLAIAGGKLHAPLAAEGADEIAAMGRAVEIFRKNTLERDELLAERAQAAERLKKEVEERTEELARSLAELRALGEVSRAVNSTINLETVLCTIVANAVLLSGTQAGTIYVLDEASEVFQPRSTYGMDEALIAGIKGSPVRVGDATVVDQAAVQRTPVQIADIRNDDPLRVHEAIIRSGFRALLTIPLLGADRIVGALVVRRNQPGEFPKETVELLQTFAVQSVLAIQNARLFHEIEEKARELEVASRHKSQFVANMSHELRTPLAAILGYAELMQEGFYEPLGEKSLDALTRIRSNGKHLLGLINTVLDIAKIESGQFSLNMAEYSIDSMVETVRVATESLAQNKKLALKTEVAKSLPIGIGDEQRLTQVLLNLVGNAIKFTDAGEVRVTAKAVNGHFAVSVADTGPGIPASEQAPIFEQFHQVDSSNTKAKGGTGLGLAIAKQIVEMHGGRIWVESTLGKGSTFQMELPMRAEFRKSAS
jgi:signal transduction histidine kinase/HAMP domain-containing protein